MAPAPPRRRPAGAPTTTRAPIRYSATILAAGAALSRSIPSHRASAFAFAPAPLPASPSRLGLGRRGAARGAPPPSSTSSSSSRSSSSSSALSLSLPDLDDAIYAAQSAASDLALSSGLTSADGASGLSLASLSLLYGAGLLTSFSPCSLGLLPLTVSYISSAAGGSSDDEEGGAGAGSTVGPTAAFAAGLASVFCGLGLSAALLGNVFGSSGGNDNFLATLALAALSGGVSIAMGLQLLELIDLPLPSFELDAARFESSNGASSSAGDAGSTVLFDDDGNILPPTESKPSEDGGGGGRGGALLRTFLLGGSSALVASPCATPVLTSILAYVATTRDPAIGSALLLTYTLGYTTPLLVIGASGGQALANARMAAERGEDSLVGKIGAFVTPATAAVLIWYGTNGMLEAALGDPSLAGLAPILE